MCGTTPGGGVEFIHAFWTAATALDPDALELNEARRFPFCTQGALTELAREAGLAHIECAPMEVPTVFRDFEDFWHPFTLGTGPAPAYCASLAPEAQQRLRDKLHDALAAREDGAIPLHARAWAIKALAP